jgi:hypothetical protein
MFRCQCGCAREDSQSKSAVYKTVVYNERLDDGRWVQRTKRVFVSPAEKPVKIVVETRPRKYTNHWYDEEGIRHTFFTEGSEIVKELMVRPEHLAAVKEKYGLT